MEGVEEEANILEAEMDPVELGSEKPVERFGIIH